MSTDARFPQNPQPATPGLLFDATETLGSFSTSGEHDRHSVYEGYDLSPWCTSVWKRSFDLVCVIPALLLLSPFMAVVAAIIRSTSSGPVIFRQRRAGRNRELFTIYKFRTMVENSETIGPEHTAKGDPRITTFGRFLRRFKLDELPQLYNVLRGDMSMVGPRPKLLHHEQSRMVCRPGVTGAATLAFRREQQLLCQIPAGRLEEFYQDYVAPLKQELDQEFMRRESLVTDVAILFATVLRIGKYLTLRDLLTAPSDQEIQRKALFTMTYHLRAGIMTSDRTASR